MSLALSCSWNSLKHLTAKNITEEITSLGFDAVELDFRLTQDIINQFKTLVADRVIRVTSVHNFCPVPDGIERRLALPDCFSISSLNEEIRTKAVKFSKRSVDTARMLNASAVVMHCGRVEIENKTPDLKQLYRLSLNGSRDYEKSKEEFISLRAKHSVPYLSAAIASIKEISAYAKEKGIKIGVENRIYYQEIPSFEEIGSILSETDKETVYYWHDTGHAQILENLSLATHINYLKEYGGRLLGIHLHDVSGADDHIPPPKGGVDFSIIKPYLTNRVIKVIEVHQPATGDEIKSAARFLTSLYGSE